MPRPRSDIRLRLIRAARTLFLRHGVDGAALRAIAVKAGTNIGMVYYYFPSKDDLFAAVIEEIYEKLLADLSVVFAKESHPRQKLQRLFERMAALDKVELEVVRLMVSEAIMSSARRKQLLERFLRGHVPMLLEVLTEGVESGVFVHAHPAVLMMATLALAGPAQLVGRFVLSQVSIPAPGTLTPEKVSETLLSLLERGIVRA